MNSIKQSLAWWCFAHKVAADELIREAAAIGYAGVEMSPQEQWPAIRDAGMQIATLGGHASLSDGLNKPSNHMRIRDEIARNLDTAVEWGIPVLIVFSGNRNGLSDADGMKHTIDGLRMAAPLAEQAGVALAMELLNSKVDHADYQCDRTPWGVEVCKAVGSPQVKLLYDIYHMQIMEGDVIRTIRDNHEYIAHYHTAGNPGRNDLDETQELYYPAIMRAIADTGYTGFVGQEFMPKGEPLAGLRAGFEVCRSG